MIITRVGKTFIRFKSLASMDNTIFTTLSKTYEGNLINSIHLYFANGA